VEEVEQLNMGGNLGGWDIGGDNLDAYRLS